MNAAALGRALRAAGASLLVAVTLGLAACGEDTLNFEDLSGAELQSLLYMREEEKLARDVYQALYDTWKDTIFQNIAASEANHTEAVVALIRKYNLVDPAVNNPAGVFTDPKFQQLYETYVAQGRASRLGAITVGVTIEELDIKDIGSWLAQVERDDIRSVYTSLVCGSRNHLRSYHAELLASGGAYVPQFITQAEFDAIVAAPMETCG